MTCNTRIVALAFAAGLASASLTARAGDLNPPAGPVASSMKTLVEVEPRIAINATNTPGHATALFAITQPGSYYLTGNIIGVAGKAGIHVNSNHVTLDLMGFNLQNWAGAGALDGILVSFGINIAIVNGTIDGWTGGDGIDATGIGNVRLERLQVRDNGSGLKVGINSIVKDCAVYGNDGTYGILTGNGSIVSNCAVRQNNSAVGINAGADNMITHCVSTSNGGSFGSNGITAGAGSTVANCVSSSNGGDGIQVSSQCRVTDNHCRQNGSGAGDGCGIRATGGDNRIDGNNVIGNDRGIDVTASGNFIVRNSAKGSTGSGNPSANYDFNGNFGQVYGDIINVTGQVGSAGPWVNFSF